MAILDVERLLEPVSEESPCGPNLEYDDLFISFEDAARGKAEQQYGETIIPAEEPDWREVRRLGVDLLSRTKDLRVGCLLARSLLETDGLPAFAEALVLIRGYLAAILAVRASAIGSGRRQRSNIAGQHGLLVK